MSPHAWIILQNYWFGLIPYYLHAPDNVKTFIPRIKKYAQPHIIKIVIHSNKMSNVDIIKWIKFRIMIRRGSKDVTCAVRTCPCFLVGLELLLRGLWPKRSQCVMSIDCLYDTKRQELPRVNCLHFSQLVDQHII